MLDIVYQLYVSNNLLYSYLNIKCLILYISHMFQNLLCSYFLTVGLALKQFRISLHLNYNQLKYLGSGEIGFIWL